MRRKIKKNEMKNMPQRESNVELLRIIAAIGVIVLHYNNPIIGGGFTFVRSHGLSDYFLTVMESVFICAVDLFVLISGYFLSKKNSRNIFRVFELFFQTILYTLVFYIFSIVIGNNTFSVRRLFGCFIPTNWFVTLYAVLFLISPFINIAYNNLSRQSKKLMVGLMVVLFSIYPTLVDILSEFCHKQFYGLSSIGMYGSQYGYSIVNYILMYTIGCYLADNSLKNGIDSKNRTGKKDRIVVHLFLVIAIITLWSRLDLIIGYEVERTAWEYCNPLVVYEAVLIFILFRRIKINNAVINKIASGTFSVYLAHEHFLPFLKIEKYLKFDSVIITVIHLLVSVIVVFTLCLFVDLIYKVLVKRIIGALKDRMPNTDIEY